MPNLAVYKIRSRTFVEAGGGGGVLAVGRVGTVVSSDFKGLLSPISARWMALEGVGVELKGYGTGNWVISLKGSWALEGDGVRIE